MSNNLFFKLLVHLRRSPVLVHMPEDPTRAKMPEGLGTRRGEHGQKNGATKYTGSGNLVEVPGVLDQSDEYFIAILTGAAAPVSARNPCNFALAHSH
jgi:hypothetical protein